MNLASRIWKCHVSGDGGGIVDLVETAESCDRAAAWRWLSELSGVPLRNISTEESERYRRAMESTQAESKQLYREWAAAVDTLGAYANQWFKLYHSLRDQFWNSAELSSEERNTLRADIEAAWWWYSILRQQQDTLIGADPQKLVTILRHTAKRRAA